MTTIVINSNGQYDDLISTMIPVYVVFNYEKFVVFVISVLHISCMYFGLSEDMKVVLQTLHMYV